jgi:hypothetical protein
VVFVTYVPTRQCRFTFLFETTTPICQIIHHTPPPHPMTLRISRTTELHMHSRNRHMFLKVMLIRSLLLLCSHKTNPIITQRSQVRSLKRTPTPQDLPPKRNANKTCRTIKHTDKKKPSSLWLRSSHIQHKQPFSYIHARHHQDAQRPSSFALRLRSRQYVNRNRCDNE